jgi:hypothetical protein
MIEKRHTLREDQRNRVWIGRIRVNNDLEKCGNVLKPRAVVLVNVELKPNVSQISSVSITIIIIIITIIIIDPGYGDL